MVRKDSWRTYCIKRQNLINLMIVHLLYRENFPICEIRQIRWQKIHMMKKLMTSLKLHILVIIRQQLYILKLKRLELKMFFDFLVDQFTQNTDLTDKFPHQDFGFCWSFDSWSSERLSACWWFAFFCSLVDIWYGHAFQFISSFCWR